jgi:hypothetical protein
MREMAVVQTDTIPGFDLQKLHILEKKIMETHEYFIS